MGDRNESALGPDVSAEYDKCLDFLRLYSFMGSLKYQELLVSW